MCTTVFDKGGSVIPFENVARAERMADGRLRVFMKNPGDATPGSPRAVTFVSAEHADEFINAFKEFHECKANNKV